MSIKRKLLLWYYYIDDREWDRVYSNHRHTESTCECGVAVSIQEVLQEVHRMVRQRLKTRSWSCLKQTADWYLLINER